MSKAIEVVIREPGITWQDFTTRVIAGLIATFLGAWFVMLLVPYVFGIDLGYWQVVGFMVILRFVWPHTRFPYLRTSEKQKVSK